MVETTGVCVCGCWAGIIVGLVILCDHVSCVMFCFDDV